MRPRPGQGTFIVGTLPRTDPAAQARFLASMTEWLRRRVQQALVPTTSKRSIAPQFATASRREWHERRLETDGLGKQYGRRWALLGCTLVDPRRARSSGSSGRTAPARPPCCISPSGCWRRPRVRSPFSVDVRATARRSSDGSVSSRRTPRPTQDSRSPSTSAWGRGSTRVGTVIWPSAGSISSGSTPASRPGRCLVASAPRSPLRWRSPNVPSFSCSMSRWPASTRSHGASFCKGLWKSSPSTASRVVLSSHLVADLERVCDYLVVLVDSQRPTGR